MSEVVNQAEVVSVRPNKIIVQVTNLNDFKVAGETLKVGSYIKILNNDDAILIAIIENFSIGFDKSNERIYIIEALPLGVLNNGQFIRGGDTIAIPPRHVEPATIEDIKSIYGSIPDEKN